MNSNAKKIPRCPHCGRYNSMCAEVNSFMRAIARSVCSKKYHGVKRYEEIPDPWNDTTC